MSEHPATYAVPASARIMLRIVEGAPIALYQADEASSPEMLGARYDLFPYDGGYAWGYSGSGPLSLAHAITAKAFQDDHQPADQIRALAHAVLERCIAPLSSEMEYDLPVTMIRQADTAAAAAHAHGLHATAKAFAAGERVTFGGPEFPALNTPHNDTSVARMRITDDEQRQLRTPE